MQEKGIEKRCSIYRMCLSGLCLIFICVGSVGMVLASENVTDAVELADRPGFTPQQIDIWVNEDGSVIINREISRSNDLDFLRSTIESKLSQSWKVQVNLESTAACPQQLVTGIKNILSDLGIIPHHKISPKLEFVQRGYRVSPVIEMKYLFTNALIYLQEDVFRAYYAEYPVDEDSADYPVTISARHFPGYTASIAISYGEDEIPDGMRVEKTPVGEKLVLAGAQDGLTELSVLINRDGVYVNNRLISDFKLETLQAVLFRELEARTYSSVVLNSSGLFRKNTVAEIEALFGEMKMPYENRSIRDQVPVDTHTSIFIAQDKYPDLIGVDVVPWETRIKVDKNGNRFVMAKPVLYLDNEVPAHMRIRRSPFGDKLVFINPQQANEPVEFYFPSRPHSKGDDTRPQPVKIGQWYAGTAFNLANIPAGKIKIETTNYPDRLVFVVHN